MDKKTYITRIALWTAVVGALAILAIGLCFGRVIEGSLFAEVAKWVVVGVAVVGILEAFIYMAVGPLLWHFLHERKK